jgi:hypothetical protein
MIEVNLERLRVQRKNIDRYRRLLATRLADLERAYIERRLGQEQSAMKALLRETLPDRLSGPPPWMDGRTTSLELNALLHPADAFGHPMDVIDDCDLTSYEKRAILSSWAADACDASESGRPDRPTAVSFDDILDALRLLESEPKPAADRGRRSGRHSGEQSSGHSFL